MYDTEFGTDWENLGKEAALERAFALGVARALGKPNQEEYDRVVADADTSYERSLIELSYDEGRRKASGRSGDGTAVWEELVVEPTGASEADTAADAPKSRTSRPDMMSRPEPTAVPDDGMDRLQLPEFLRQR
ncbi:hypothetical protein SAMN04488065_0696 [Haloplanus vescus]|uniref:Uncharacterized protein n=1 Tax=Haloplanus vescus TaxID=555874 RepID=A0A1H3WA71_9EURY|nr:hypothetical protein [Haloplanus vescus]SDZ84019.1 hypothetical protein SAMN04488065_0696 [Haloplanus vescus]